MKNLLIIILAISTRIIAYADSLQVEKFSRYESSDGIFVEKRKDLNGEESAVVEVRGLNNRSVLFQGNIIGSPLKSQDGSYYVYLCNGTKMLNISVAGLLPVLMYFCDYGVENVERGKYYLLELKVRHQEQSVMTDAKVLYNAGLVKKAMELCKTESQPTGELVYFMAELCLELEDIDGYVEYIKKAALLNDKDALNKNAYFYYNGKYGFQKNTFKAIRLFERSAANGCADSMYVLAGIFLDNNSTYYDESKAKELLIRLLQSGTDEYDLCELNAKLGAIFEYENDYSSAEYHYGLALKYEDSIYEAEAKAGLDRIKVKLRR